MIPNNGKEESHLEIGRRLWNSLPDVELAEYGFAVVRQLSLGASRLVEQDEKYRVTELLYRAGQHATRSASFDEAMSYFDLGLSLLGARKWRDEYYLSLDLYTAAAQVAYSTGRYERVHLLVEEVFQNARESRHGLKACIAWMESLVAKNDTQRAFEFGLKVLRDSGRVTIPKNVGTLTIIWDLLKVKRILRQNSDNKIKSLPRLCDEEFFDLMTVMGLVTGYALYCRPLFAPFLAMRVVLLAFKNGICEPAATSFALLGSLFCNHFGDVELGYRLAQLGLDLNELLKSYEWQTRTLLLVHSYVFVIRGAVADQLAPLLTGHREGIAHGNIESAMLCAAMNTAISLSASVPLKLVIADAEVFLKVMKSYRQTTIIQFLLPHMQFALNMANRNCDNPVDLSGEVMNEARFRTERAANNPLAIAALDNRKVKIACYFQEYKVGEAAAERISRKAIDGFTTFDRVDLFLYSGICHAGLASINPSRKEQRHRFVKKALRQLKALVRFSEGRYDAHVRALEAELAGIQRKTEAAISTFYI